MDFDVVRELASIFQTSLTATAIRLAEHGPLPGMLVCYSDGSRRWFVRGSEVPEQVWPSKTIEPKTYAHDLLKSPTERNLRGEVSADAWFDHEVADRHYI